MTAPATPFRRSSIIWRITMSLLCVVGGWLVLSAYLHGHFYVLRILNKSPYPAEFGTFQQLRPDWWQAPLMIATFALPYIAVTWLFFVLPTFLVVRDRSWLWRWPVTSLLFAAMSALIMLAAIRLNEAPVFDDAVPFAAITGAATGLLGALAHRRYRRR